jgi:hypothetical protein
VGGAAHSPLHALLASPTQVKLLLHVNVIDDNRYRQ